MSLIGLLRREVDAVFLKGAYGAQAAHDFGLVTVIDTGSHPDPLIRSNNGTPRTLTVDANLIENHFDATVKPLQEFVFSSNWENAAFKWSEPEGNSEERALPVAIALEIVRARGAYS